MSLELLTFLVFAGNALFTIANVVWTRRQIRSSLSQAAADKLDGRVMACERHVDQLQAEVGRLGPEQQELFGLFRRLASDLADVKGTLRAAESDIESTRRLVEEIHRVILGSRSGGMG